MASYAFKSLTQDIEGNNQVYVDGKWRKTDWNPDWENPKTQEKARKGEFNGDVYGGEQAPTSKDPNYKWVSTGTFRKPEWSGGGVTAGDRSMTRPTSSVQSKWERIFVGSKAAPAETQQAKATQAPATSSVAPAALGARQDAYERAQQYQKETAAVPRAVVPNDPQSPDFYRDLNNYGKAYVDDYLKGQVTEQKRVALATDENAYFANQSLQRIDPKKMNVSQADTWKDTLSRLQQLKGLIT